MMSEGVENRFYYINRGHRFIRVLPQIRFPYSRGRVEQGEREVSAWSGSTRSLHRGGTRAATTGAERASAGDRERGMARALYVGFIDSCGSSGGEGS